MNAAQAHRGPDGQAVFEDPSAEVALGHVRLAILDLTDQASQPMMSDDGRFVIVFNGEIYNYRELRSSLQESCRSTGDTEVLLRGLQQYGVEFIDRLNGIFAIALWDNHKRHLLLARDQLGVKPLYYAEPEPGTLLFASEIKAICAHPGVRREPNFLALQQHMAFCHACGDHTALKGIWRLPAGHLLNWSAATRQSVIQPFWKPSFDVASNNNEDQAVEELRERLFTAVDRQMVSDVPVGTYLSGGLDSSLITKMAADKGNVKGCYTITYPSEHNRLDQIQEDAPYARIVAKQLDVPLNEVEVSPDVTSLWPMLIRHLDEPIVDSAAIACYLISKLARDQGTKVLLSGQGADELFGGYPRYWAMHASRFSEFIPRPLAQLIAQSARFIPGAISGKAGGAFRRARKVLLEVSESPHQRFLNLCMKSRELDIYGILSDEFKAEVNGTAPSSSCFSRMHSHDLQGTSAYLERDLGVYLPNHNLLYTDKMSMAVGLEARVPLIDIDVAEYSTRLPVQWKVSRGQTKRILRKAAEGLISQDVIYRRKAGFGAPYRSWLRHDLADMWNELTSVEATNKRGWFRPEALQKIRQISQAGKADLYMLQWAVLTIELWARQFIDSNPSTATLESHESLMR